MPQKPRLELFQLYHDYPSPSQRIDIEEARNLAAEMPHKAEQMRKELFHRLDEMNASYPYQNPYYKGISAHKEMVCSLVRNGKIGNEVWAQFREHGSRVTGGQICYTLNGGMKSEEWYVTPAQIKGNRLIGTLPIGSTHYVFNLVDEHNFLVSYPEMPDKLEAGKMKGQCPYSNAAIKVAGN